MYHITYPLVKFLSCTHLNLLKYVLNIDPDLKPTFNVQKGFPKPE